MSGIEAVGLVLGVFPVCVKLVNAYREKVRDEEVHQLDRSLNNRATIFLNATIELLAAVVSKRELSAMLEDPNAELWHNEAFNMKLRTQLGNRCDIPIATLEYRYSALVILTAYHQRCHTAFQYCVEDLGNHSKTTASSTGKVQSPP